MRRLATGADIPGAAADADDGCAGVKAGGHRFGAPVLAWSSVLQFLCSVTRFCEASVFEASHPFRSALCSICKWHPQSPFCVCVVRNPDSTIRNFILGAPNMQPPFIHSGAMMRADWRVLVWNPPRKSPTSPGHTVCASRTACR